MAKQAFTRILDKVKVHGIGGSFCYAMNPTKRNVIVVERASIPVGTAEMPVHGVKKNSGA